MAEELNVQEIVKIDPEGKYVLIVSSSSATELDRTIQYLRERIDDWLRKSDDPFLIIGGSVEFKLVRVDK